jgi:hypothetical protein
VSSEDCEAAGFELFRTVEARALGSRLADPTVSPNGDPSAGVGVGAG